METQSLFRRELIHPLVTHFPLALLLVGVVVRFVAAFTCNKKVACFLFPASWIFFAIGVLSAWGAIWSGEVAKAVVKPTLCDVTVLKNHDHFAYRAAWGFSVALVLDWVQAWLSRYNLRKVRWILIPIVWVFLIAGSTYLILAGNLGASLVYDQGAAVDCSCQRDKST